jgi:hypothetical protein
MLDIQKIYNYSFIIRLILNIVLFIINKFYNLPIIFHFIFLFIIDSIDYNNLPYLLTKNNIFKNKKDTHNYLIKNNIRFYYDILDKLCDIISYVLFLNLLNLNVDKTFYYYIILYRLFGLFLFIINKNYINIVFFPDLFKELIGYELFINQNFKNINRINIIIIKTLFEYIKLKYYDKLL